MSPLAVEMLIWFCTRAAEAGPFRGVPECQPQMEIINSFLDNGAVEPWENASQAYTFRATDKGRAWLEMICATPMPVPVQTWADPRDPRP